MFAFAHALTFLPSEENCTTCGTYWDLIGDYQTKAKTVSHLRSWEAVQNLLKEVARWPSEVSDAGLVV